jgi:hypothetical protein
MSQDELSQVKQDMQRLTANVKELLARDGKVCCSNQEGNLACDSKCANHRHVWMYLSLTALAAGIAGVMLAKKSA